MPSFMASAACTEGCLQTKDGCRRGQKKSLHKSDAHAQMLLQAQAAIFGAAGLHSSLHLAEEWSLKPKWNAERKKRRTQPVAKLLTKAST